MITVTGHIVVTQLFMHYRIYTEYSAILTYLNFSQVLQLISSQKTKIKVLDSFPLL